jgi:hypothetical protein
MADLFDVPQLHINCFLKSKTPRDAIEEVSDIVTKIFQNFFQNIQCEILLKVSFRDQEE